MQNPTIRVLKWEIEPVKTAIITLLYAGAEVIVIALGPALLLCFAWVPGAALSCLQFEQVTAGEIWSTTYVQSILQQLASQGLLSTKIELVSIVSRLPNLNITATANAVLAIMHAAGLRAFVWALTITNSVHTPRKISNTNIEGLRNNLEDFMKTSGMKAPEFAKHAGLGLNTLYAFMKNEKDTQRANLDKIRSALERLQK